MSIGLTVLLCAVFMVPVGFLLGNWSSGFKITKRDATINTLLQNLLQADKDRLRIAKFHLDQQKEKSVGDILFDDIRTIIDRINEKEDPQKPTS